MCDPGAIHWIEVAFNDCIVTSRDKVSFAVGLVSNIVFLFSAIPQIIMNFKTKSVEGQSPFFLLLLLVGSVFNLVGVLVTKGLITQILTGIFYVLSDGILLAQYITYKYIKKPSIAEEEGHKELNDLSDPAVDGAPGAPLGAAVLAVHASAATDYKTPYAGSQLVGTLFGWGSAIIFTASRFPQMIKNCKDRKVGQLSPFYFTLSIVGNFTYFVSILIRDLSGTFLWKQTPFIVGAIGPMIGDIVVAVQMILFREQPVDAGYTGDSDSDIDMGDKDEEKLSEV